MKIVLAPKITHSNLGDLERTIKEHHELLMITYSVSLTPKEHLITYYPMIIKNVGPPREYWTMRFESKHAFFKDLARKLRNYNDLTFTMAVRHQIYMLCLSEHRNIISTDEPLLRHSKRIELTRNFYNEVINTHLSIALDAIVCTGTLVEFKGATLRLNKYICSSITNDLPVFKKILFFFSVDSGVYCVCEDYRTLGVSSRCTGYVIEKNCNSVSVNEISKLPFTKAWDLFSMSDTDESIIITEYFL